MDKRSRSGLMWRFRGDGVGVGVRSGRSVSTRPSRDGEFDGEAGTGRREWPCRMEFINRSYSVSSFGGVGGAMRRDTGTSGGRERMNSKITSCASFFTGR